MSKNNIIFFVIVCAILGCFYLFMHYQVKSAEDLIDQVEVSSSPAEPTEAATPSESAKKVKPIPEFVEPIEVDDGFETGGAVPEDEEFIGD